MNRLNLLIGTFVLAAGLVSCSTNMTKIERTPNTEDLLMKIKKMPEKGIMFGHHDDPVYGIGWDGDLNRSDVKSVCGDYPAVMGFDLGHIELGKAKNLDNVSFARIKNEILAQHKRGGVISLSWHLDSPVTGKDSWDISDTTVVASVLFGGVNHEKFLGWLDKVADFMNSLVMPDGVKVPILFRPWHEHTGSWFWWGKNLCTTQQYKDLWRLTYDRLQEKGVRNVLYTYSAGAEPKDTAEYLDRYPGDDIIDLLGFDTYQMDRQQYIENMERSLTILTAVGKAHDKPIAVTETGYEAIPDSTWWTETLLPVISKYPISYVLVWRNAREKEGHYYAPYPGQVSAEDFVKFYQSPKTLFLSDLKNIKF